MLMIQERRTPAQAAAGARRTTRPTWTAFSEALGSTKPLRGAARAPLNALMDQGATTTASPIIGAGKDAFNRPRPYALETQLKPAVPLPGGASYPSGHTIWAYMTALVLADMVPERRLQILARADEFARNRVIAGVHYPSDVESGRMTATIFTAFLFASPAFETERVGAAKELRKALGLSALPGGAAESLTRYFGGA